MPGRELASRAERAFLRERVRSFLSDDYELAYAPCSVILIALGWLPDELRSHRGELPRIVVADVLSLLRGGVVRLLSLAREKFGLLVPQTVEALVALSCLCGPLLVSLLRSGIIADQEASILRCGCAQVASAIGGRA